MLNAVVANGDIETLKELFAVYEKINDEKEILKIAGKILNKCIKLQKDDVIEILDKCYDIVEKYRDDYRTLENLTIDEEANGKNFIFKIK